MKPESPTVLALTEALENHIRETEPDETVLTSAIVIWEGAGVDGWSMNYVILPSGASPATTFGLAMYGYEEMKGIYHGDAPPPDEEDSDADGS